MAALGDIGKATALTPSRFSHGMFGRNATQPNSIIASGAPAYTNAVLTSRAGQVVDIAQSNSIGDIAFYDIDNGIYKVLAMSGDVWEATVVGGSVTVVQLLAAFRTTGRAYIG